MTTDEILAKYKLELSQANQELNNEIARLNNSGLSYVLNQFYGGPEKFPYFRLEKIRDKAFEKHKKFKEAQERNKMSAELRQYEPY